MLFLSLFLLFFLVFAHRFCLAVLESDAKGATSDAVWFDSRQGLHLAGDVIEKPVRHKEMNIMETDARERVEGEGEESEHD